MHKEGILWNITIWYLYTKYGEHVSNNGYYFCHFPKTIMQNMQNDSEYMTHVGAYEIESIWDLRYPGYDSTTPDKKPLFSVSKLSPMMTLRFKNGTVAQF